MFEFEVWDSIWQDCPNEYTVVYKKVEVFLFLQHSSFLWENLRGDWEQEGTSANMLFSEK